MNSEPRCVTSPLRPPGSVERQMELHTRDGEAMAESILGSARGHAGPKLEVLGRGGMPRAFTIRRDGITVESRTAVELVVARVTYAPGSASGWLHRGPMLAVVTRGSLTWYAAEDCNAQTFPSCVAFA